MSRFKKPPLFAQGSVSEDGQTVQVILEDGSCHRFHIDEAAALVECRVFAERHPDVVLNTPEFEMLTLL